MNEDELARTATAHDSAPASVVTPAGETIGRYRLERELGIGGMGVVHVAFDPDLERRVALKVLRAATGDGAAKRLQREARAMARLNHPNVVTVHEVGSAAGRDYVAMELIDGESLAEWLRAQRREPRAIVEAFIAAGRGLAAAHAAGIVHRDFKPHNVLRSRGGRIAVTDFGLAREASDPMATTMPVAAGSTTPSSLSGLTMSGSVLGTPAYMAPEQWSGGEVTPATDQFGFCVALWEALSGERPYRGPTIEDLRTQVAAGPQALDASKIPRRLRSILRRGLDPDRAKRWSSMDVLLDELARAQRRSWMLFAALGAGAVAAAVLVVVLRGRSAGAGCPAPILDPAAAWGDDAPAAMLAAGQGAAGKLLADDHRRWIDTRTSACAFEPARRAVALACLDGVLARFDAVARAAAAPGQLPLDVGSALIDPRVCGATSAPRLVASTSSQFQETIATRLREQADPGDTVESSIAALAERAAPDPCAAALAQTFLADVTRSPAIRDRAADLADQAADRCGDDRIRAELALSTVLHALQSEYVAGAFGSKLARAEAAVQRVPQADLNAQLAQYRMITDERSEKFDQAIVDGQVAVEGYASRGRIEQQVRVGIRMIQVRQTRATPEDYAAIASSLASLRTLGVAQLGPQHEVVRLLDSVDAGWAWANGDVVGSHPRLEALRRALPNLDGRPIAGMVVDQAGVPVAGATVAAGKRFNGDSIGVMLPFTEDVGTIRTATTGADGTFRINDAVPDGIVIAQLGDQRSAAMVIAPQVRIVVGPTSTLSGHVDLRGVPSSKVIVGASVHNAPPGTDYAVVAPVSRDGTFRLDGAPRGEVDLIVAIPAVSGQNTGIHMLTITEPVVGGLEFAVPATKRTIKVIVRSTVDAPPLNAAVLVFPGKQPESLTLRELSDKFGELGGINQRLARPIEGRDLGVDIAAPEGTASACGIGLPSDIDDPALQRAQTTFPDKIQVRCVPIPPDAPSVVVHVPPWPRFD